MSCARTNDGYWTCTMCVVYDIDNMLIYTAATHSLTHARCCCCSTITLLLLQPGAPAGREGTTHKQNRGLVSWRESSSTSTPMMALPRSRTAGATAYNRVSREPREGLVLYFNVCERIPPSPVLCPRGPRSPTSRVASCWEQMSCILMLGARSCRTQCNSQNAQWCRRWPSSSQTILPSESA